MGSLRVAFFTGNHNYAIDGVALTSNRQVAYLESVGIPVRVYAPTKARPILEHSGPLVSVPSVPFVPPYRLAVGMTSRVRRDLAEFRPTLVHIATPDPLGFAALRWARRHDVPAVTTYHTHWVRYLRFYRLAFLSRVVWRLHRRFYGRCAEVYVAGRSMADELRRHRVHANYVISPFGVDTDRFSPENRSAVWRAAHGIGPDDVVVLFVGRLVWEKGLDHFANVVRRLEDAGVPLRSVVVGDGVAGPELRTRLPGTTFTGRLGGDELAVAFASSDVFFFPSASETFGCVTVEALASGLPCVVADATGSRDIVRDGSEGLVCPPEDEEAFASAVERLVRDGQTRGRMREAALKRASEYRWDTVLARMVENFERTAGHAPSFSVSVGGA
jgi:glycosyltransferase involved in cell wall biosynthesis